MVKIFILFIPLLFISCTENPFSKSNISETGNRLISGTVMTLGEADQSGVFVWLEELNISTWTDEGGNFSIKIPAKSESVPGGGLTQYATIYYYIANFRMEKSQVYIFDGSFKYDEADLNEKGQIKNTIRLQKIVDISVVFSPNKFVYNPLDTTFIRLEMIGLDTSSVTIVTYQSKNQGLSGFLVRSISDPNKQINNLFGGNLQLDYLGNRTWVRELLESEIVLDPGVYEILPYFEIRQDVPPGLITAIAKNANEFHDDHFKIPMRYHPAIFEITE